MDNDRNTVNTDATAELNEITDNDETGELHFQDDEQSEAEQSEEKPDPEEERREKEKQIIAEYKSLALPKYEKSEIEPELLVKDVKTFIQDMKKKIIPDDSSIRIIPSNMACRFELPVDLTRLKDEDPLSYLKQYCEVTDSRKSAYKRKYEKYQEELTVVTVLDLQRMYKEIYQKSNLKEESLHLQRLLDLDLSMELDEETFTKLSCFMERIMLKSSNCRLPDVHQKNPFEESNFSALNGKLKGLDISPSVASLLKYIRST